jgi:hypothetical protein
MAGSEIIPGPWMTVGMSPKRESWFNRVLDRVLADGCRPTSGRCSGSRLRDSGGIRRKSRKKARNENDSARITKRRATRKMLILNAKPLTRKIVYVNKPREVIFAVARDSQTTPHI